MPVSCYICGRDFGTKSINIHVPQCIKKWENEQKRLPKSQRRPPPQPPADLDKVISGEITGEELEKFNSETLREWNDSALVPCESCQRTFLPQSLKIHEKSCTPERPMIKQQRESYASRAESKVSYPTKYRRKKKESSQNGEDSLPESEDTPELVEAQGSKRNRQTNKKKKRKELPDINKDNRREGSGTADDDDDEEEVLSRTYIKGREDEDGGPSREYLASIILNNTALDSSKNRLELEAMITRFIAEKLVMSPPENS